MSSTQLSDRFPTVAILVPPLGSVVCVLALRLLVGNEELHMRGAAALIVVAMVAFLWLGVVVEVVVLPIGLLKLWRKQAARTPLRLVAIGAGFLYLAAFAIWLVRS